MITNILLTYSSTGYYYGWDWTYMLVLIGAIISMIASRYVTSTYQKYSNVRSASGMTGAEVAERILREEGLFDVRVEHINGHLTDNYRPATKVLSLSDATFNSTSIAALGVAAHECGHAIQYAKGYAPIKVRGIIHPFANWGSRISWILIFLGLLINGSASQTLLNLGIFAFSLAVILQIIILPIEFDASARAMRILEQKGILGTSELKITRKVLTAAAYTYVAAVAASLLQLLRLIILFGNRNRKR